MTVIKSKTGFIFGGYTAVEWTIRTDKTYKTDNTAFLFTLTNPASMPLKMKIKEGSEHYAVYHYSSWGPIFGNGWDLAVSSESNSNTNSFTISGDTYEGRLEVGYEGGKFIRGGTTDLITYFQTVEVEVFKIE